MIFSGGGPSYKRPRKRYTVDERPWDGSPPDWVSMILGVIFVALISIGGWLGWWPG